MAVVAFSHDFIRINHTKICTGEQTPNQWRYVPDKLITKQRRKADTEAKTSQRLRRGEPWPFCGWPEAVLTGIGSMKAAHVRRGGSIFCCGGSFLLLAAGKLSRRGLLCPAWRQLVVVPVWHTSINIALQHVIVYQSEASATRQALTASESYPSAH